MRTRCTWRNRHGHRKAPGNHLSHRPHKAVVSDYSNTFESGLQCMCATESAVHTHPTPHSACGQGRSREEYVLGMCAKRSGWVGGVHGEGEWDTRWSHGGWFRCLITTGDSRMGEKNHILKHRSSSHHNKDAHTHTPRGSSGSSGLT